jgi:hypothetical protein
MCSTAEQKPTVSQAEIFCSRPTVALTGDLSLQLTPA